MIGTLIDWVLMIAACFGVLMVYVAGYASTQTNPKKIKDSVAAFIIWSTIALIFALAVL